LLSETAGEIGPFDLVIQQEPGRKEHNEENADGQKYQQYLKQICGQVYVGAEPAQHLN